MFLPIFFIVGCLQSQAIQAINIPKNIPLICRISEVPSDHMITFRFTDGTYQSFYLGKKGGRITIPQSKQISGCKQDKVILPSKFQKLQSFIKTDNNEFTYEGRYPVIRVLGLDQNGKRKGQELYFEVIYPKQRLLVPETKDNFTFWGFPINWKI